jgi:hypothetical protein
MAQEGNGEAVAAAVTSGAQTESSIQKWIVRTAKWLFGLFGAASILYAVGYLVLTSHFSMLGIWSDGAWSKSDVVAEGARFFYQLVLFPASLSEWRGVSLVVLIVAALAIDLSPRVRAAVAAHLPAAIVNRARGLRLPSVVLAVALVATGVMFETHLRVASLAIADGTSELSNQLRDADQRGALYGSLVARTFLIAALAWLLERKLWKNAKLLHRLAIALQWSTAVAALLMLPIAHGRLNLPFDYPVFQHPALPAKETRMVLARTPEYWVLWNAQTRETELFPTRNEGVVKLGPRRSVLVSPEVASP